MSIPAIMKIIPVCRIVSGGTENEPLSWTIIKIIPPIINAIPSIAEKIPW